MLNGIHRNSLQEQVIYGRPALEALAELAAGFSARRLMITTTASLAGPDGLATRLAKDLGDLCVGVFAEISAHSPREAVIEGAGQARRLNADLLAAVGGGSVIDATKVMQIALWAGIERTEDLESYRAGSGPGRADVGKLTPGIRMVAVSTTLSAAEFTPFAGVTDVSRQSKEGYAHPLLAPRAVVLDPAVTLSTPARLWFSTGMKAVDHAVEQLCNPIRSPYADALAQAGLEDLATALPCVALPAVLRWNETAAPERQKLVARLLGRPELSAAEAVKALARSLDLPTDLKAIGIGEDQFLAIAEHTMGDRGVRSNPRPIKGPGDIVEILELARG